MDVTFAVFSLMVGGMAGIVTYGTLTILFGRFLPELPAPREVDDETVVILTGGAR